MQIREACPDDAPVLAAFNQQMAMESEGKQLDEETVAQGVRHVFQNPEAGRYLVAEREGSVVGGLLLTREWSDWRNAHFWWIQSVYVVEEHREQGVYRALHEEVVRQAREAGSVCGVRLYVDANNHIAQQTYEALGMEASNYRLYEQMIL